MRKHQNCLLGSPVGSFFVRFAYSYRLSRRFPRLRVAFRFAFRVFVSSIGLAFRVFASLSGLAFRFLRQLADRPRPLWCSGALALEMSACIAVF